MHSIQKPTFTILTKDKTTRARLGLLHTSHGVIRTPSYVMVATHAQIKTLKPADIRKTKTQVVIANTYHLWPRAAELKIQNSKLKISPSFLTKKLGVTLPTMTDSGGFQVFSLGAAKEHGVGKVLKRGQAKEHNGQSKVKFTEKGAHFNLDGKKQFLSPEISMALQTRIGADLIFAFDECTSPLHPYKYQKNSLERTHRWLVRCVRACGQGSNVGGQLLYGIIQGGRFASLRKLSAKFVASQPVGGIGIGGSFGKDEMVKTLKDIVNYLPEEKPRHLLGIGRIEDIFIAVENGMDTFDCVIPTREARHAKIYTDRGAYDIRKNIYSNDKSPLGKNCGCPACKQGITRSKLRALFKATSLKAGRYATLHNIWFFNNLLEKIRNSIAQGRFISFKQKYLKSFAR